jgi:hypothetical protein
MTRFTPQWLQSGLYAASVDRRLIGALWPTPASTGCAVTAASGMTVNIAPGQVAVPSANSTGSLLCSSDAVEQVTLAAAPGSGSNRYDLVTCQARGNDLDGGANNDFIFTTVTGVAASSPAIPATPNNAVALAQIYVPGGSASVTAGNITDRRPGALAVPAYSGAVFATTAARDAAWPNPPDGATCVVTATNTFYQRISGMWYTPFAVIGYVDRQSNAGPQGVEAAFMNTPSIVVPPNRRIMVECGFRGINTSAPNTNSFLRIRQGTTVAGAELVGVQVPANSTQAGNGGVLARPLNNPASPLQVCVTLEGQSNNATLQATPTSPCWLQLRDVGPI